MLDTSEARKFAQTVSLAAEGIELMRQDLRMTMGNEQREIEKVVCEPKMNVVPNHVATKE